MVHFAAAEKLRPHGDDSAILRWNSCVRRLRSVEAQRAPAPHEPPELTDE
jgi:hypothetical protein